MSWKRATFNMTVSRGYEQPESMAVDGWVNHPFAIDERIYTYDCRRKGWCITHLPTGYAALFVLGPRTLAAKVADALAAAADWEFTEPSQSKHRAHAAQAAKGQFPKGTFTDGDKLTTAKPAFVYPEERTA